ncbi:suppressor of fused domain protein [Hahella aquimaris]|uniref:suppressor of fused domain protein n=1 Tax=Hahella sp. HNIBRBA332 TaxID=3015983 RepID=UPI00273B321F|nr:suppressor of fused domain protein [Hahella sp. HNIBRBA332]WLQ14316.1 suppressor of fused domain protein [Hahella sp. HNIBRBA332]
MAENVLSDNAKILVNDIRRSVILYHYIAQWGQPITRTISSNKNSSVDVEVYEFFSKDDEIYRIATIGISGQSIEANGLANWEFLLSLPADCGGVGSTEIVNYLLDIMAYSLRSDVEVKAGNTIPETPLAPAPWTTKAVLFDEPRGEPEEMSSFIVGNQVVNLIWLVPVTEEERLFIKRCGIDEFDKRESISEYSLIDVKRVGVV